MEDLFSGAAEAARQARAPLADRMRPRSLDEIVGQEKLITPGAPLRTVIERDALVSCIFWGPPGSGKTTLAKLVAHLTHARFVELSAVSSGVAEMRMILKAAEEEQKFLRTRTIVFIDEIHRFNKSQQDALLPSVERGLITLIGATTENPSFEVNAALLSRCRVFVLEKLGEEQIKSLLLRALADEERGLGHEHVLLGEGVLDSLVMVADGDARQALNLLELAVRSAAIAADGTITLTREHVAAASERTQVYDKNGEEHYNIISALHKSLRGSDVQAALYWLGRMLEAGEDPLFVARRLIRFASEDVGMADPMALLQATAAYQASHDIGMPECNVILAQAVAYLAKAPKSNALYLAYQAVQEDIQNLPHEPVPFVIRNAPTKLMKNLGYGKGYGYPTSQEGKKIESFLPEKLKGRHYF